MNSTATDSIAGAVEACRRRLVGISDTPWLDARILASHITGLDASAIVAYGDNRLASARREKLLALVERRAHGEPVAYLVGFKEFCGNRIAVDRRVLVPRPETEELVAAVADDWRHAPAEILELGTGSGAIACALAQLLPEARITATDASAAALEVAGANVNALGLVDRIRLRAGDLFNAAPAAEKYDAIVANLPYVGDEDPALDPDVRAHEPAQALFAGADGLEVYKRMFAAAPARLHDAGKVYCECGPNNAAGLAAIARDAFPQRSIEIRRDAAGLERMVIVS
jgi:release factor glutamine methyltransferase